MYFMFSNIFSEARVVNDLLCKNVVESDRPQATIYYGACALHAGYLRLQTRTKNM
jgi:hypothetical protein